MADETQMQPTSAAAPGLMGMDARGALAFAKLAEDQALSYEQLLGYARHLISQDAELGARVLKAWIREE